MLRREGRILNRSSSHQERTHQDATNAIKIERNYSRNSKPDRYPVAHNGLVAGSDPDGTAGL